MKWNYILALAFSGDVTFASITLKRNLARDMVWICEFLKVCEIYLWLEWGDDFNKKVLKQLEISSGTVVDSNSYMWEVCVNALIQCPHNKIGWFNMIVEVNVYKTKE